MTGKYHELPIALNHTNRLRSVALRYTGTMTTDSETLYRQLGRLIETMPDLTQAPLPPDIHLWIARAYALVNEVGNSIDFALFTTAVNNLGAAGISTLAHEKRRNAAYEITAIIYRAFAVAELNAPVGASGAFIPVGNSFDAFAAFSKLLQTASKDVLIVDPYMDETALTEFGIAVPEGIALRLLSDQSSHKPTLEPAAKKWAAQHGTNRPLAVRLAPAKALHDRAIFIDQTTAWTLTQSLKDFAKNSPAEIIRADDTATLKIAAYEWIWKTALVVV